MRTVVTGGGGFLGSYVVERLRARGLDPVVPRRADYDLPSTPASRACSRRRARSSSSTSRPSSAGSARTARTRAASSTTNAIMGIQLMEQARLAGVGKFVRVGTVCAYPKFTPVPFHEDDLWNGYPEETNAPYGLAKKMLLVRARPTAQQYGFNAIHLLPVNLYGPRRQLRPGTLARDPGADPQDASRPRSAASHIEVWGDGSPRASSSTSRTRPRASCSRRSATTAPTRSTSAPARRSRSGTWRS